MIEYLEDCAKAYYSGSPMISDDVFDFLSDKYNASNIKVGAKQGDIPHSTRMYSLDKVYEGDPMPTNIQDYYVSPKLDGNAVSILISGGEITLGLTRGDGFLGKDITEKMRYLIPDLDAAEYEHELVQITGEVVGRADIKNSRNVTAGVLNTLDMREFESKCEEYGIVFIAYNIEIFRDGVWSRLTESYEKDLDIIDEFFCMDTVKDVTEDDNLPTDGIVYRVNDNIKYYELGFTDKFPKGAFALKRQQEHVETVLLDVIWQVGKTGKVTPVAILKPVEIGGAVVSKATLHNGAFIANLGIYLGAKVKVIRQGEIIPCILGLADD